MKADVEPTANRFLDNPCYVQYVELLLQLHALMAEGKSESEEAEAIRDAMDKPWYGMTQAEQYRVGIMSADLYMIEGDEVFRPVPPEERTAAWLQPRIEHAMRIGDWESMLAFLRNGPNDMSSDRLAALRAYAYRKLGHPEVSWLFLQFAAGINPKNELYQGLALMTLAQFDLHKATMQAEQLLKNRETPPLLLLIAASYVYKNVPRDVPAERGMLIRIVRALKRIVNTKSNSMDAILYDGFMKNLSLILSGSYLRLGQEQDAMQALNLVLKRQPENADYIRLRDLLLLRKAQPSDDTTSDLAFLAALEQAKLQAFNQISDFAPAA